MLTNMYEFRPISTIFRCSVETVDPASPVGQRHLMSASSTILPVQMSQRALIRSDWLIPEDRQK